MQGILIGGAVIIGFIGGSPFIKSITEPTPIVYAREEVEEEQVEEIERSVEEITREYFADIPVMIEVARCESTFRQNKPDGTVLTGHVDPDDTGVMQINKRYHLKTAINLGLDLDVLEDNLAYGRWLYEQQGLQPWSASRPCWGA